MHAANLDGSHARLWRTYNIVALPCIVLTVSTLAIPCRIAVTEFASGIRRGSYGAAEVIYLKALAKELVCSNLLKIKLLED